MDTVILVVDDNTTNLALAQKILGKEYRIAAANSGFAALKYMENHRPDLILMDINMPGMDGFETVEQMKQKSEQASIPVIFLTAEKSAETETLCFQKGASDFVNKPFVPEVLLSRVKRILELERYSSSLKEMVEAKTQQIEGITLQAIGAIANTIDAKDEYTKGHSVRVADYSVQIAKAYGLSKDEQKNLKNIALLHDIGKIGVPDAVLNKPGRLTELEFQIIKSHTVIGAGILKDIQIIDQLQEGALYHHERYDGHGYPTGLSGEEIPLYARIIGIADAYDAMSSDRIYRKKLSESTIREQLVKGSGTQFDPEILEKFLKLLDAGKVQRRENAGAVEPAVADNQKLLMEIEQEDIRKTQDDLEKTDHLTRLLTRREGEKQIARAVMEQDGCLVLIDIDRLKQVNDCYGHLSGDYVLQTVSNLLILKPKERIAVRFGGDEFLYWIKCSDKEIAEEWARNAVSIYNQQAHDDEVLGATSLSIGLCMCRKGEAVDYLMKNVYQALYTAKQCETSEYRFFKNYEKEEINQSSVDLKRLVSIFNDRHSKDGTFEVKYGKFNQIYDYVDRLSKRNKCPLQMIMITAQIRDEEQDMEKENIIMERMHSAIQSSLRSVDVLTRFSSAQYLVILLDAGRDSVQMIVNRIFQRFFQLYDGYDAEVNYDIAELEAEHE